MESDRRTFLISTATAGVVGLMATLPRALAEEGAGEEEVSPAEDLMREHGVLKRVLLIYGEGVRRIDSGADLPPEVIAGGATIIRDFIEDYHEKLEEDYLFPRFRKANRLVDLVDVLVAQHRAGRRLTDQVLALATPRGLKDPEDRRRLADSLRQFIRMYEPHEAREDTVLFPALRKIVTPNEYAALGEDFEKKEHELFGEGGFDAMVDRVAALEKALGIYDLAQFTPKA
ncbi:hemerythrin domain-containing protein [Tautonia sociabilis]|uniref:Hemerythrin domain-containing protein n=1 Tax=Tautonia sociabilis TaxID=2080755 RepID=A0A432MD34_9BACT|nr:hemerythrin domain-containing protein [Tautonia sociabilis]RUL82535.1 hemerythrin domain-containing protein [Tautonia sociabilis]